MTAYDKNPAGAASEAPAEFVPAEDDRERVSRETLDRVFGRGLKYADEYAHMLAVDGTQRGLIGPRETPRLWERHLLNCAVVAELVPDGADVLDVGSGAGLPGIPLAIARPDLLVTLVEPMERRTAFLSEVVTRLGIDNIEVLRARAEDVNPRGKADVVTCRAVAPIGKLAGWCLPLLRPGGQLLAIKGSSAEAELAKHRKAVLRQGGDRPHVLRCGEFLDTPSTVIRVDRR